MLLTEYTVRIKKQRQKKKKLPLKRNKTIVFNLIFVLIFYGVGLVFGQTKTQQEIRKKFI